MQVTGVPWPDLDFGPIDAPRGGALTSRSIPDSDAVALSLGA